MILIFHIFKFPGNNEPWWCILEDPSGIPIVHGSSGYVYCEHNKDIDALKKDAISFANKLDINYTFNG